MAARIKRATITLDNLCRELFHLGGGDRRPRGYLTILDELQRNLQDKGDDPRYGRVVFASDGQDKYVELTDRDINLAGVFPRVTAVRYSYGKDNSVIRNSFSVNIRDTLIVVDSEKMAKMWEKELTSLDYQIRRL